MTEQTIDNKVLERIKKMLALSNDSGATEAERETALRMAYNTLAKYNLSLRDLPSEQDTEVRERQDVVISADRWARNLSMAVAKLFFCKYFYSQTGTSGKDKHCFVGRQSNVITAKYMSEYLIKAIKREASKRYASPTTPNGRSFCVGTVRSVSSRVETMLQQDAEGTPGTAVALIGIHKREEEANAAWLADDGTELVTSKPRTDNSLRAGAYNRGKEYGKSVSLNHQVTNTAKDFKRLN